MGVRSKKLYMDMTTEEKELLRKTLEKIQIKYFTKHAMDRMNEKDISRSEVYEILRDYTIIELNHEEGTNPRLLLRGNIRDRKGYHTCISLDIIAFKVITAYKNKCDDIHKTLDYSRYTDLNIKEILKIN